MVLHGWLLLGHRLDDGCANQLELQLQIGLQLNK